MYFLYLYLSSSFSVCTVYHRVLCSIMNTHSMLLFLQGPLLAMLEMLELTVCSLGQEEARNLAPQLGNLFSLCLDYRAQQSEVACVCVPSLCALCSF